MSSIRFYREISKKIDLLANEFPGIVLTGARQTGKTTILRELFPQHTYVSLDLPATAEMAKNNPDLFLDKYPPPVIIDEVQYAPEVLRHLKIWIDENRSLKGHIILTGGQRFELMQGIGDSLAGRVGVCELEGLSLFEITQELKDLGNTDLPRIMCRGFSPELWKESNRSALNFHDSYYRTYLERDVRDLIRVTNLNDFDKFMKLACSRVGQLLNKSELAKAVGVRLNTISSWLSVLEASNQITLLHPYHENFGKRVVKSPKLYFNDIGLCLYLLGIDEDSLLRSPLLGSLFENTVVMEFIKRKKATNSRSSFYFYRDNQGREVDLLEVVAGVVNFYECKWNTNPTLKDTSKIEAVANDLKSKAVVAGKCTIVSRSQEFFDISSKTSTHSLFHF